MKKKTRRRRIPNYRKLYCEYHGLSKIPKGYHVHHKNKKRWDNRKENLILLRASRHMSLHARHRVRIKSVSIYTAAQMAKYHGIR